MRLRAFLVGVALCGLLAGSAVANVVIMGENSDGSATNNSYSKGNVVTVDEPAVVDWMGLYLTGVPAGTNLLWAIYEGDAVNGPFTKIHETVEQVAGGNGYFDSPAMNVPLNVGKYYWLGGFWDQPVTYYYSNTQPGAPLYFDFGFGTMTYHGRKGAFNTFPGPGEFSGAPSTNAPYWQRYSIIPEPASGALLLGALVLGTLRRR